MYRRLLWRSAAQALGHMHGVWSSSDQVTSIFDINFADSKNIEFTVCILSRPTLSITVTETVVKVYSGRHAETMEVESGSHWGQTILLSERSTSTKPPIMATQLSLALQQVLRFHS